LGTAKLRAVQNGYLKKGVSMTKRRSDTTLQRPGSNGKDSGLVVVDQVNDLQGIDVDIEVAMMVDGLQPSFPRVRIDHSPSGRHRMFLDLGESYDDGQSDQVDLPGNSFSGIVVYAQTVSAYWVDGEPVPRYTAINGKVTSNPGSIIHASQAKDKVRLFVLTWLDDKPQLVIFNLSPTSIKHWRTHVQRLGRSKAPAIAVVTSFHLQDTQRNSFRWAEVVCNVERVVNQDELNMALSLRDECEAMFGEIGESDFSDPGDRMDGGER
jgi:hypothetical protein